MNFITGREHLSRRTFIRGTGASVALPFLDAMVPAGRGWRDPAQEQFTRLVCVEESMGCAGRERLGRLAEPLRSCEGRPRLRVQDGQPAQAARGVPGLPDRGQQHGLPHG